MSNMFYDYYSQASKVSLTPFLELNSISTKVTGDIVRHTVKAMNEAMENNTEHCQKMSHVKDLEGIWNLQSQWMAKALPQTFSHAQQILNTMLEGANEYHRWFEKGMERFQKENKLKNPLHVTEEKSHKK